jgi:hypothetical protein
MPPVRYELGFYIPEDDILHSHRSEHLKSYTAYAVSKTVPQWQTRVCGQTTQHNANPVHTTPTILRVSTCRPNECISCKGIHTL